MDTKTPLSFKEYLNYEGEHQSKEARKLAKKTPKNKIMGGSNTFSNKEKENNRDGITRHVNEKIEPFNVQLSKGLTRDEAWKQAFKRASRDFRGMKSYDEKTGKAVLI